MIEKKKLTPKLAESPPKEMLPISTVDFQLQQDQLPVALGGSEQKTIAVSEESYPIVLVSD